MTWPDNVVRFANAVKVAEGSNPDWNNPGDLTGADAENFPTCGTANAEGVLKFRYPEDGWNALCIKINRIFSGHSKVYPLTMTLQDVGLKYSGHDPNWAINVGKYLNVPISTTLAQIAQLPLTQ